MVTLPGEESAVGDFTAHTMFLAYFATDEPDASVMTSRLSHTEVRCRR